MKNAKKLTALLLAAAMLCSCGGNAPAGTPEASEASEAEETSAPDVTEAAPAESEAAPEAAAVTEAANSSPKKKNLPLLTWDELSNGRLESDEYTRQYFYFENLAYVPIYREYGKGNALHVSGYNLCRESTFMLGNGVKDAVNSASLGGEIESPYNFYYADPLFNLTAVEGSKAIKVDSIDFIAQCSDGIILRGFMRKKSDNAAEFIVDPAYMRGIPVFSLNAEELCFDIDGEKVYMDTIPTNAQYSWRAEDKKFSDVLAGDNFYYVEVVSSRLEVGYNTKTGYNCICEADEVTVLSEDASSALCGAMLGDKDGEKSPEMTATYDALSDNLDTIYTDDTYGIALLDMDFDGTPEVLVSRYAENEDKESVGSMWCKATDDVDIYRIKDGGLKYIDTMHIAHWVVYEIYARLGLKTLPDGTKAWFATTIEAGDDGLLAETDCLYTLVGDTLKKTEVFREGEMTDDEKYEDGVVDVKPGYFYYYGEKITPKVTPIDLENAEDPIMYIATYSWGDVSAHFGTWELYGFARADFCEDIKESYLLYSDWLTDREGAGLYGIKRRDVAKRDVLYNLAYTVDAFYLGEYSPNRKQYRYWFLGDYAKPVIYLYPEQETDVSVSVDFTDGGAITCSYPDYNGGWEVTAMPDGTLYDANGDEYYCLYWEGVGSTVYDNSRGFCVAGKDTAAFLREKLMYMGLTAREANEFIIYWLPLMQDNPYNIITFHTEDYSAAVPLTVSPAPDSVIRVFMTYRASDEAVEIPPQELPKYERNGFTLVEWGGDEQ